MNLVFNGLPGVFAAGDAHVLLDRWVACSECGTGCPVFTPALQRTITESPLRSWEILGEVVGARHVYFQAGSWVQYARIGDPDMAVVYYRDVRAWVASFALWEISGRRFAYELPDAPPLADLSYVERAINHWVQFYEANLLWLSERTRRDDLDPADPFGWVSFDTDQFTDRPLPALASLCDALGIRFHANAVHFWAGEHHRIGGRHTLKPGAGRDGQRSRFGNRLARDDAWRRYLPASAVKMIDDHERVNAILRQLKSANCAAEESCES